MPAQSAPVSPDPNQKVQTPRADAPGPDEQYIVRAVTQDNDGPWRFLRGAVRIETAEMQLKADELDWNTETSYVEARGHVHFEQFARGEIVDCDKAEYYLEDDTKVGKFYNVKGSGTPRISARPGLLTSTNPFYFESRWAERLADHYVLYDAFLTDCSVPRPWWVLRGPKFDLYPRDHAVAHRSWFYLRRVPLFYVPVFYKSLKKEPRKSGFLIPTVGNNSLLGAMAGFGYYWAINRSYDLTYRGIYYSNAGLANHLDFRGKVNQNTDFNLNVFAVKATTPSTSTTDYSGSHITLQAKSILGHGWEARGDLDYLSSLSFLQQFTQSFNEAVASETHSVGFATKHWDDFGIDFVAQRNVNFQSTTPGNTIEIRKLPEVDFTEREHEIDVWKWPFWVSFDSSAGLLRRTQPEFQTRQFVDRLDFAPHVTTAFRWAGIQLIPSFGIRETSYGSSLNNGTVTGQDVLRSSRDATVDLVLPSLERVFDAPKWIGEKVKHIIEPRVTYKYVTGIDDFERLIRFDETDLFTNTNQIEFSLTNRLLAKDKNGTVSDFLTWQLYYDRYFDPTFGGAVVAGQIQRNVLLSTIDLTGYAFLDRPRHDSPIVSAVRIQSKVGFEWRADYDATRRGFSNSSVTMDGRINQLWWSVGHTDVKTDPKLMPPANQFRAAAHYGNSNRRGWNYQGTVYYDFHQGMLQFWQAEATYNTDCCGISVQYRRFFAGTRDDSQFQVAFAVSNIGTFGTLKRQERVF